MRLTARLSAVTRLAGSGRSVIDVGTDHGYVPVWLRLNGKFERIAASDINPGPLDRARTTAREQGVEGSIDFRLTDGLRGVDEPFDTVIVAGMGGETMAGILDACPWIGSARLVLQPQSKVRELAGWLDRRGFVCREACAVADGGKLYVAFAAQAGPGGFRLMEALIDARQPLLPELLGRERDRIARAMEGAARGGTDSDTYTALRRELEALDAAISEVEKW